MTLFHPKFKKCFHYYLPHKYLTIGSDLGYITFAAADVILNCMTSTCYFS